MWRNVFAGLGLFCNSADAVRTLAGGDLDAFASSNGSYQLPYNQQVQQRQEQPRYHRAPGPGYVPGTLKQNILKAQPTYRAIAAAKKGQNVAARSAYRANTALSCPMDETFRSNRCWPKKDIRETSTSLHQKLWVFELAQLASAVYDLTQQAVPGEWPVDWVLIDSGDIKPLWDSNAAGGGHYLVGAGHTHKVAVYQRPRDKKCVLAFSGSEDRRHWLVENPNIAEATWCNGIQAHAGFSKIAEDFLEGIGSPRGRIGQTLSSSANCLGGVYTAGHSLGGAIASLVGACLLHKPRTHPFKIQGIYTIGAPATLVATSWSAAHGANGHGNGCVPGARSFIVGDPVPAANSAFYSHLPTRAIRINPTNTFQSSAKDALAERSIFQSNATTRAIQLGQHGVVPDVLDCAERPVPHPVTNTPNLRDDSIAAPHQHLRVAYLKELAFWRER